MIDSLRLLAVKIQANEVGIPKIDADGSTMNSVLNMVFAIAGVVCVGFIIAGGIRYSTSHGNPGNLQKAKETVIYAVVGLVVVIAAFTIVNFVLTNL